MSYVSLRTTVRSGYSNDVFLLRKTKQIKEHCMCFYVMCMYIKNIYYSRTLNSCFCKLLLENKKVLLETPLFWNKILPAEVSHWSSLRPHRKYFCLLWTWITSNSLIPLSPVLKIFEFSFLMCFIRILNTLPLEYMLLSPLGNQVLWVHTFNCM